MTGRQRGRRTPTSLSTLLKAASAVFGGGFGDYLVAAAAGDLPPEVRANVIPRQIQRGRLLQVQAIFVDRKTGEPVRQDRIYMRIRSGSGLDVYPPSILALDQSGMVINIGTADFAPGRYTVMIGNSPSFSPSDTVPLVVIADPALVEEPAPLLLEPTAAEDRPEGTPLPPDREHLRKKVKADEDLVPVVPLIPSDRSTFALQSGLVRFVTELDLKVCHICAPFDGETYAVDDVNKPNIPIHPNCLLPDTRCEAPGGIVSGLRAWYDGPIIEAEIASGARLSITPNHNLLTPKGWISADLLREGDDVICSPAIDWSLRQSSSTVPSSAEAIPGPNVNRKPASIKEIFVTLQKSAGMTTVSMPAAAEYLHGDARLCQGKIDIVGSDRLLWNCNHSAVLQQTKQAALIMAQLASPFNTDRPLAQKLKILASAADSIMGGRREPAPFFRGRLRHTQIHRFTSAPLDNPGFIQHSDNGVAGASEMLSKSLHRFAGSVEFQKVVKVNVRRWTGHVYDLQTLPTVYVAEGIIVSNCRCHYEYVSPLRSQ